MLGLFVPPRMPDGAAVRGSADGRQPVTTHHAPPISDVFVLGKSGVFAPGGPPTLDSASPGTVAVSPAISTRASSATTVPMASRSMSVSSSASSVRQSLPIAAIRVCVAGANSAQASPNLWSASAW